MGLDWTDAFLMKVSEISGQEIPESLAKERGRLVDMMTDSHAWLHGKKFGLRITSYNVCYTKLLRNGPYLEATPPFSLAATLEELMNQQVIDSDFDKIAAEAEIYRPLYVHQEEAIRLRMQESKKLLLSSGCPQRTM